MGVFGKVFGERCGRCGVPRTKKEFEGLPTCPECELKIKAAREEPRRCPMDNTEMTKEVVLNIIVDHCPQCRGAWLDGGELKLLKDAIESGQGEFAAGMVLGMAM